MWQNQWARLYPEGSKSREVINEIHDNYLLVNLVDNDYVAGNCLFEALKKAVALTEKKFPKTSSENNETSCSDEQ